MARGGKDMGGLIFLAFIIGIPLFILANFWPIILIVVGIVGIIAIIYVIANNTKIKDIQSAEIVDRTQRTKEKYQHSGISLSTRGGVRGYWRVKTVPTHVEVKFSVTDTDGKVKFVSTNEGTERYNYIMQYVGQPNVKDAPIEPQEMVKSVHPPVRRNELCSGTYVFGEDIACGKYDLVAVSGGGQIALYKKEHPSEMSIFENFGLTESWMSREHRNIQCESGDRIMVTGSVVIKIHRSHPIEI